MSFSACSQISENKAKITSKEAPSENQNTEKMSTGETHSNVQKHESPDVNSGVRLESSSNRIVKQETQNLIAFDVYGMTKEEVEKFQSFIQNFDQNVRSVMLDEKEGFYTLSITLSKGIKKDTLLGIFRKYGISEIYFNNHKV